MILIQQSSFVFGPISNTLWCAGIWHIGFLFHEFSLSINYRHLNLACNQFHFLFQSSIDSCSLRNLCIRQDWKAIKPEERPLSYITDIFIILLTATNHAVLWLRASQKCIILLNETKGHAGKCQTVLKTVSTSCSEVNTNKVKVWYFSIPPHEGKLSCIAFCIIYHCMHCNIEYQHDIFNK